MTNLLAARGQMAMSLAFHIVFAAVGMAMPLFMVIAEARFLRTGRAHFLALAKRWSKGVAVLFAVGAVSGTVLSFELGLLWPRFMAFAGSVIGMPFSLEGFAFFLEAIFLGLYLYGWERLSPRAHVFCGIGVGVCGVASALFVVCANAWMNTPAGFELTAAGPVHIDVWAAMFNAASLSEGIHMVLAAFAAVGFAMAGVHAAMLLRRPSEVHHAALRIALLVGGIAAVLQPVSGDYAAKVVARTQPVKLAAMEAEWETQTHAPLRIGGVPDTAREETRLAIEIPSLLSVMAYGSPGAEVRGLRSFPRELRPPVWPVHVAFQIMVAAGTAMAAIAVLAFFLRRDLAVKRWFLFLLCAASPLGFVAIEAGWVVTEVGRQPWIVQGFVRTADAVTPAPHLAVSFAVFTGLYVVLAVVVVALFRAIVLTSEPS
jgi:cytochrome d ubiquinol oxidase subunit I